MMDEDVVEIENVENVCRLCLATDGPRSSVFATEKEDDEREDSSGVPLADKIQACLSIQISATDKLSTLICANCVKNVNQWHTYKESCLRSQDKLQEWLANQLHLNPTVVTIKDEPMDIDYEDNVEIISEITNNLEQQSQPIQTVEHNEPNDEKEQDKTDNNDAKDNNEEPIPEPIPSGIVETEKETDKEENQTEENRTEETHQEDVPLRSIKCEPQDDDDTDCTIELESTNSSELLMNSMSVDETDTVMEADSTQKSNSVGAPAKKKFRRGPHTHFRGTRVFKQKCMHCQIFLHSKYSYMKHMNRFHSKENGVENLESQNDEEEMIEDLEDELVSMEKDSPLTQVQQDIISQLKTFSCYSCEQTFNDRRSTLSHIRQHLPDLRPYTCIACLTEFPDRSMYQLHCGASFECAMKIALVVPKIGNERYFTCNMCLRSMPGRKELLSHLSKHSDKQYEEMMGPARAPPKLKPMAPLSSPTKNSNKITGGLPYKNGDPTHNHACDLCGMIYRYRPNMLKHKEMCKQLDPESRTLYKCVHCYMTFIVFKKFHYHVTADHKKKDFTCATCHSKFRSPSDFLAHHETHREAQSNQQVQHDSSNSQNAVQTPLKERNAYETNTKSKMSPRISSEKFNCPLCPKKFSTKVELNEHRTLHLKVKIYSCAICRSMFSSAGALEIHMKDHGIDDPNERNANVSCVEYGSLNEDVAIDKDSMNTSTVSDPGSQSHKCSECGKVMSSYANLRRHFKIAHRNSKVYDCAECSRMFMRKDLYENHMQLKHNGKKTMIQCPECPKSFVFQTNFSYHFRTAHLEKSQNGYACDICGKVFNEEASLKIHRGWHNRANSRLSTRFILGSPRSSNNAQRESSNVESTGETSERPARARKSFPNPPLQSPMKKTSGNFQCQVCNDKFNDVTELRTHLWDVHCARNKPEKNFSNDELQCELCTNIFPDQETLAAHMRWHKANPILSDIRKTFTCDVCGKCYSSKKVLYKHKRLHKATVVASIKFQSLARKPMASQFLCNFCRKIFSSSQSLQRHKLSFHSEPLNQQRSQQQQQLYNSNRALSFEDEPRTKRMKYELENDSQAKLSPFAMDFAGERRKPVMCHVCKKMFANMSVLYKHKQIVHKARKDSTLECIPMSTGNGKFSCNICFKEFPGLSNLRQHFTIKHKKARAQSEASGASSNDRLSLPTPERPKEVPSYEVAYNNIMYSCKLCKQCHVFNKGSIMSHITNVHNTVYEADSKMFHREVNLSTYVVNDAFGATCPQCDVKYPNNRALKIHYIKFHDNAD
ncbi:zinc finger protein 62 [Monomorium pharaonis]|uniref:zinc finger protein 62 n=1 Tax=Monomorium pharaonis TaxID=307658 RepID=UPI00063F2571|nr:zinc finger protein 62 [Monomorium pharaonis]